MELTQAQKEYIKQKGEPLYMLLKKHGMISKKGEKNVSKQSIDDREPNKGSRVKAA